MIGGTRLNTFQPSLVHLAVTARRPFAACLEVRAPYSVGMIKRLGLAVLCLFSQASLLAQLRVELSFEQETYLPHEPLHAVVLVYNTSGQTLNFGKDNDWLSFHLQATDGTLVKELKPVDVEGEFALPSAQRAKKLVNLAEAYEMTQLRRFTVTATVRVADWNGETFSSREKHFGISRGANLWEGVFGLPSDQPGGRPEIRKYQLVQANQIKALSLYARIVDEADDETFFIQSLGPLLGVSKPEAQVDRWSNLHVFYQDGARSFKYHMITPDGLLLTRQTWDIDETRPSLKPDKDGRILVSGGLRRISGTDLPPPELLSESSTTTLDEPLPAAKPIADAAPPTKK